MSYSRRNVTNKSRRQYDSELLFDKILCDYHHNDVAEKRGQAQLLLMSEQKNKFSLNSISTNKKSKKQNHMLRNRNSDDDILSLEDIFNDSSITPPSDSTSIELNANIQHCVVSDVKHHQSSHIKHSVSRRCRSTRGHSSASEQLLDVLFARPNNHTLNLFIMRSLQITRTQLTQLCIKRNGEGRICRGDKSDIEISAGWLNELNVVVEQLLLAGADPNITDSDGRFPLYVVLHLNAIPNKFDRFNLFELLLRHRADPFQKFQMQSLVDIALKLRSELTHTLIKLHVVPLHVHQNSLCIENQLVPVAKAHGYESEALVLLKRTLFDAIEAHNDTLCRALLQHGAPVQLMMNDIGDTLVMRALKCRAPSPLLKVLLVAGVSPCQCDTSGTHPLQLPLMWRDEQRSVATISLLIVYGAHINVMINDGSSSASTSISLIEWADHHSLHDAATQYLRDHIQA